MLLQSLPMSGEIFYPFTQCSKRYNFYSGQFKTSQKSALLLLDGKEKRERFLYLMRVCNKCNVLKARFEVLLYFIAFVCRMFFRLSIQYIFCCVVSSGLPVCVGGFCGCCGVKVVLRSRMLPREEREVLGKSSVPQATQPTS